MAKKFYSESNEPEPGPSSKRIKLENKSTSTVAAAINISTPASSIASTDTVSTFKDPNFYKIKKPPRTVNSNIHEESLPSCSKYATPDTNPSIFDTKSTVALKEKEEKQETMKTHESGNISSDEPTNRASSPVPTTSVETTNQTSSMEIKHLPEGFYEALEYCSQLTAYVEACPSSMFSKKLKTELRKVLRSMIAWKRFVTKRPPMKWLQIQLTPLNVEK